MPDLRGAAVVFKRLSTKAKGDVDQFNKRIPVPEWAFSKFYLVLGGDAETAGATGSDGRNRRGLKSAPTKALQEETTMGCFSTDAGVGDCLFWRPFAADTRRAP